MFFFYYLITMWSIPLIYTSLLAHFPMAPLCLLGVVFELLEPSTLPFTFALMNPCIDLVPDVVKVQTLPVPDKCPIIGWENEDRVGRHLYPLPIPPLLIGWAFESTAGPEQLRRFWDIMLLHCISVSGLGQ